MVPSIKEENKNSNAMEVISINHTQIVAIGAVRLNCPSDLRSSDNQKSVYKSLQVISRKNTVLCNSLSSSDITGCFQETKRRFSEIPLLDPINDMKISAKNLKKSIDNLQAVEAKLQAMPLHNAPNVVELTEIYAEKHKVMQYLGLGLVEF